MPYSPISEVYNNVSSARNPREVMTPVSMIDDLYPDFSQPRAPQRAAQPEPKIYPSILPPTLPPSLPSPSCICESTQTARELKHIKNLLLIIVVILLFFLLLSIARK